MTTKRPQADPVRRHRPPVIIYSRSPKPIRVAAENFQTLVQSLTGAAARKRKPEVVVDLAAEAAAASGPASEDEARHAYLDKLEAKCPPSRASANRGLFPTAGLVKGVRIEDGLQSFECCPGDDSPASELSLGEAGAEERDFSHLYSPLTALFPEEELASDWTAGPCCLSPRSYQVVRLAKRTAVRRPLSGSGPWKISPETMMAHDSWSEEWDSQVDRLYRSGEITLVREG